MVTMLGQESGSILTVSTVEEPWKRSFSLELGCHTHTQSVAHFCLTMHASCLTKTTIAMHFFNIFVYIIHGVT